MRNSKGFTMIELLAVLIIIMSIAAFSIASVMNNSRRFEASEAMEKLGYLRRELQLVAQLSEAGGGTYDFSNGGNIEAGYVTTQMGIDSDFLIGDHYTDSDYYIIGIGTDWFTLQARSGPLDKELSPVVQINDTGNITLDQPDATTF